MNLNENKIKVCIIGKDKRSIWLERLFKEDEKYKVTDIKEASIVYLPIPITRDNIHINTEDITINEVIPKLKGKIVYTGSVNEIVKEKLIENNINFIDLINFEEFSVLNAIATSEGAIKKAIELTDVTLNSSNILILGFGRIGRILAHQLSSFGANIYCEARKNKDIAIIKSIGYNVVELNDVEANISKMDIIFNTIPHCILDSKMLEKVKEDVCIIDLASSPGGIDFEYAKKNKINYEWYLGIPSKDSPKTAAKYIKEVAETLTKEGEKTWEKKLS